MQGEYKGCAFLQSPNYTQGSGTPKNVVVMHTTEGGPDAQEAADWFHSSGSQVSANFVVGQDSKIIECVLIDDVPWAAPGANQRGDHIELASRMMENPPHGPWPDNQLQTGAEIAGWLLNLRKLPLDRLHLLGHVDLPGQTHTDPGPYFNWPDFFRRVAAVMGAALGPAVWLHPQGITVQKSARFGLKWPAGTTHCYILANGRFQVYAGPAVSPIAILFKDGGPHTLTCVGYDSVSKETCRDDLRIIVA